MTTFQRSLAWRLRLWLLGLPAGTGRATVRLWLGVSPERSGVFSAGNGPAMRAAILGAALSSVADLRTLVRASSRLTHTDPKAEFGAFAVALAAHLAARESHVTPSLFLERLESLLGEEGGELIALIAGAVASVDRGEATEQYAESLGLARGVSGYVYHTVPACIHAWLSHQRDFRAAATAVIGCGGDTDSTAAIVGGIVGSSVGREGIPPEWLDALLEWPRTVAWMERLGEQLAEAVADGSSRRPLRLSAAALLGRNLLFLLVVLWHGFRRLTPPY